MTEYEYDPFDDWGIVPGPRQTPRSFQHAIRRAFDQLCCGRTEARAWLEVAIERLPASSALRQEVKHRLTAWNFDRTDI